MSDVVRPLRADEFDEWRALCGEGYARDMVESGGIDAEAAAAKAKRDLEALLVDGVTTEGHSIYAVEREGGTSAWLWLAERDTEQGRALFVYEVRVAEHARGQGLGRAAMEFAADEAHRRGLAAVTLNVFGGNDAARGLYRSLGYREVAVFMRKDV